MRGKQNEIWNKEEDESRKGERACRSMRKAEGVIDYKCQKERE